MKYKVRFDLSKEEFIDGIDIQFFNVNDEIITTKSYNTDIVKIDKHTKSLTYEADRYVYIESKDMFYNDFYTINVYLNNELLSDDKYDFDIKNKKLSFSYKLNIASGDNIKVEYYRKYCEVEIDTSQEVKNVKIINRYKNTYELGRHTNI